MSSAIFGPKQPDADGAPATADEATDSGSPTQKARSKASLANWTRGGGGGNSPVEPAFGGSPGISPALLRRGSVSSPADDLEC